jgi:hypothetical protein
MKIYFLVVLLGAIITFAHLSWKSDTQEPQAK